MFSECAHMSVSHMYLCYSDIVHIYSEKHSNTHAYTGIYVQRHGVSECPYLCFRGLHRPIMLFLRPPHTGAYPYTR